MNDIKKIVLLVLMLFGLYCFYIQGYFLPAWIKWESKNITDDINNDGISETFIIKNKNLTVQVNDFIIYKSPKSWKISDIIIADIDNNKEKELLVLCWNRTNYGDYKPFWEENDKINFSQHLYVYNIKNNILFPKWMSSVLKPNIKNWSVNDQNHILIKDYKDNFSTWAWLKWGFERIDLEKKLY